MNVLRVWKDLQRHAMCCLVHRSLPKTFPSLGLTCSRTFRLTPSAAVTDPFYVAKIKFQCFSSVWQEVGVAISYSILKHLYLHDESFGIRTPNTQNIKISNYTRARTTSRSGYRQTHKPTRCTGDANIYDQHKYRHPTSTRVIKTRRAHAGALFRAGKRPINHQRTRRGERCSIGKRPSASIPFFRTQL